MKLKSLFLVSASLILLTGCFTASDGSGGGGAKNDSSKKYGFGDTVRVEDLEFTVNSASNAKHIGSEYLGADTDNNFVIVNLKIKNAGTSEADVLSGMMTYHIDDSAYEPHSSGIYLDNGFYVIESIGAGLAKTIDVVYEIPSNFSPDDYLEVKATSYSSKGQKIYMKDLSEEQAA